MKNNYKIKTKMQNGNRIAVIDPAQAEKIFSERLSNRPLNMAQAKLYARAMEEGEWLPCSQISFCGGRLDDGQHRMMASIISGKPFEGTIYYHNNPDTFAVFDSGRKRTNADVLSIEGKKNTTQLACTLNMLERVITHGLDNRFGRSNGAKIPSYKIMDVLDKYPGIEKAVSVVHCNKSTSKLVTTAPTAILYYLLNKAVTESGYYLTERSLVDVFIVDKLFKGLELSEGDPVYTFRKKLEQARNKASSLGKGVLAITPKTMLYGGIITWNKWIKNKKCSRINIPDSSDLPKILIP
tara:strand:- start:11 stop:898 length:888 start_codon:yes stop_codon:yes gene_type:complete